MRERKHPLVTGCPIWSRTGAFGLSVGLLATACVLAGGSCSTAPSGHDGGAVPEAPGVSEGAGAPDTPAVPEGDSVPEGTRREVRQLWEKLRGLLAKGVRDPKAYRGLVDEPEGFAHIERCLAEGVDLTVEWFRMTSKDLEEAEAHFRFFLDREECEVYFMRPEEGASPRLLLRLIDGRWVVWPQRG